MMLKSNRVITSVLAGAGVGAVAGGIYGASNRDKSITGSAIAGGIAGGAAGYGFSRMATNKTISKAAPSRNQAVNPNKQLDKKSDIYTRAKADLLSKQEKLKKTYPNEQDHAVQTFKMTERALSQSDSLDPDYVQATKDFHSEFLQTAKSRGVEPIIPKIGDSFDDMFHMGTGYSNDSNLPAWKVSGVGEWGYKVGGEVLEPAKVTVSRS